MSESLPATDAEADLLRRWRDQRDRAALDELAARLLPPGWRAARAFAREHAEDVLQDAFLALTTGAAGWRGGAVRSWFVGIVANTARDHLRRQRRRPAPLPPEMPAPPEPSGPELAERVMAAWHRLPEHERVPLWLNVVEGQDCRDIAVQLGRPAGTVRAQVARAFERLRGMLGGTVAVTAISSALHQQAWAAEPPAGLAARLGDSAAVAKPVASIPIGAIAVAVAVAAAIAVFALTWQSIAVSPDGTRLAVGTQKGLHLWDIASRRRVLAIDTSSVDPRQVMVSTPDGLVEQSGRRTEGTPVHLAWLPGDRLLALVMSGFEFHHVGLWEAATGRLIRRLPLTALYYCQPATIGDSVLLVPGAQSGKEGFDRSSVLALRLDDGSELPPIIGAAPVEPGRQWSVSAIAVDAGSTRVACMATNSGANGNTGLSDAGMLSVWSWPGRIKLAERRLSKLRAGQPKLGWLADGRLLVSGAERGGKPATIMLPADLSGDEVVEPGVVHYAADGSRLRIEPGRATLVAADGGERTLAGWTAGQAWNAQVAWRPGRIVAMAGPGRAPWLFDLATDRLLAPAQATLTRCADSLIWLPDGSLLASDYSRTLRFAGGTGEARILPQNIQRHSAGDTHGGRAWGWQDGKLRVLARHSAGGGRFLLLDPSSASTPRDLDLPTGYSKLAAVSPDLRWAFVASQYGGTCSLLDLVDGTRTEWRHPYQDQSGYPSKCNPTSVRWVGGQLLISDFGGTDIPARDDQSMTGVWSLRPFHRLHRFRRTDGSEILTAIDVVPHPDGERALVVPNDSANQRAWLCRIADGICLNEIANPGGGAVWTADGAVVTGRKAAVSLATRQPTRVFADMHAPLAKASYQAVTTTGAFGVAIGLVQPSPSGTQVAVSAGDRLLVVDSRSGAISATVQFGRNLLPALAAWSPGEAEIALADSAGTTVVVVTVAEPSADAAADRAILVDASKPQAERRVALARLEASARAGASQALPEAGQDGLLAAWLNDATRRAAPEVPPPALPASAPQPSDF